MKLRSAFAATTAATATTLALITAPTAMADEGSSSGNLVVEQGDFIGIARESSAFSTKGEACTLGLNRHGSGLSYTARHCGDMKNPTPVSVVKDGTTFYNVGILYPGPNGTDATRGDWGYIRWNSNVTLGANRFSGNNYASFTSPRAGDRVCAFGQTTNQGNPYQISCGSYMERINSDSFTYRIPSSTGGDSGGPVWLNRNGQDYFLGIHSGHYTVRENGKLTDHYQRGTMPDFNFRHPADAGNVDDVTADPASISSRMGADPQGSSNLEGWEIAIIVLTAIIGLVGGAALAGM